TLDASAVKLDINKEIGKLQPNVIETQISNEAKILIARKNIVQLTRNDVADDLLRRLDIAKTAAPKDEAGMAVVTQIDNIIASIKLGNKLFDGNVVAPCW